MPPPHPPAGTWVTTVGFGHRLMELTYTVLQREADLRFELVRVGEGLELVWAGDGLVGPPGRPTCALSWFG